MKNDLDFTIWNRETNVSQANSPSKTPNTFPDERSPSNKGKPVLTDDYAEIGLLEAEGDYSTPTGKPSEYSNLIYTISTFI